MSGRGEWRDRADAGIGKLAAYWRHDMVEAAAVARRGDCLAFASSEKNRWRRRGGGPPDSDGGTVSASVTPLGCRCSALRGAQLRRETAS
jgi:hypothetical protein